MPAFDPITDCWNVPCFGGPMHGEWQEVLEDQTHFFRAEMPSTYAMTRGELQRQHIRQSFSRHTYQVITHQMRGRRGTLRRVKTAIFDGPISRRELEDYRDHLHNELRELDLSERY